MGARDELASILRDAADAAIAAGLPVLTYEGYADSAITAGWRPAPTVITDPAELDDLPDRTVILDAVGVPLQLIDNRWVGTVSGPAAAQQVPLPATVLIFLRDLPDHT
jgi:hypothetical protein